MIRGVNERDRFVEFEGYPAKVMVWACIGPGFKSDLIRVQGTLTAQGYVDMLQNTGIISALDARYGRGAFVWQQDGARPHTATTTKLFLKNRPTLLPDDLQWPVRSPDLSVIENFWEIVKSQIVYDAVTDADSLFQEAARAWNGISLDSVTRAVNEFPARLNACIAVQGDCLNQHQALLRAFQRSKGKGEREARMIQDSSQRLQQFEDASLTFFMNRARLMTPKERLRELDDTALGQAVEANKLIAGESAEIVGLLPEKLQRKLRAAQPS